MKDDYLSSGVFIGMLLVCLVWFLISLGSGDFWDYSMDDTYVIVNIERTSSHVRYELQYMGNKDNSTFIRLEDGHPSISQFVIGDTLKLVPIKLLREKGILCTNCQK